MEEVIARIILVSQACGRIEDFIVIHQGEYVAWQNTEHL